MAAAAHDELRVRFMRRGIDAMLDVLSSEGVEHIFGNPGTTELPFMDALSTHPEFHYVLALQEATAVGMAVTNFTGLPVKIAMTAPRLKFEAAKKKRSALAL